ncbi:MAG: DoxX family protein [Thermoanaerobaculum sp.]
MIFIVSGINKIMDWDGTAGYMASKGMPMVPLFLLGALVFELVGGLSVLLGFKARMGAILLIIFIVPATLIFHNFWTLEGMERQIQMMMFMKNLAILGGLLLVLGLGPGPASLDEKK